MVGLELSLGHKENKNKNCLHCHRASSVKCKLNFKILVLFSGLEIDNAYCNPKKEENEMERLDL